jgi:hypothetical protein
VKAVKRPPAPCAARRAGAGSPRWWRALRLLAGAGALAALRAATFYVDPVHGDDGAAGTSPAHAWRTLVRASGAELHPGDRLALARAARHAGGLSLAELAGTAEAPIVISSYARSEREAESPAVIDGRGALAALHLKNCRHVRVEELTLTADGGEARGDMRCGALIEADGAGEYRGLTLARLQVKGVSLAEPGFVRPAGDVKTANGNGRYGWGIRFIVRSASCVLREIAVRDCAIERVDHTGLKFTAPPGGIRDVRVEDVRVADVGGPGIQMSGVQGGHFTRLAVDRSGSTGDTRNWGRGSGLWTWNTSDVVIEHSRFTNAHGPGDSAGVHIDFRCRNVVVQYNFSAHNAGGFCEILGDNRNCAYRYNVSVDDGDRVKGRDGAFQEGKTFWLSGYVGAGARPSGPFDSYFYNNTIYVRADIDAKFAVAPSAAGVLVANNIFCIVGRSRRVAGDQARAESTAVQPIPRGLVTHNLFLHRDTWPQELGLEAEASVFGDPAFAAPGGDRLADYVPANRALVQDRGIAIAPLPGDAVGLAIGLRVDADILGNPIRGRPDLGAFELP